MKKDIKLYNLTSPQKNIWMLEELNSNTNMNNLLGLFFIRQKLDLHTLKKSINKMIELNDALRFGFKLESRFNISVCTRLCSH